MKQLFIKKGKVFIDDVPKPKVRPGYLLIKVENSCISTGTELSTVKRSGTPILKKAIENPEKIYSFLNIVRNEGYKRALTLLERKTENVQPSGYSLSGKVIATGDDVQGFKAGDRVAAFGNQWANHAEFVEVPNIMAVKIPDTVSSDVASTCAPGSIAMHALRRGKVQLGDICVVVGAGIIGNITAQMLEISGTRVIVVDISQKRLDLIENKTITKIDSSKEDMIRTIDHLTGGKGVDKVFFCAATNDPQVLSDSLNILRKKGKFVLVGVVPININREDIYKKEIDFLISSSYGPGRYDDEYESENHDYPYGYVRWTQTRNVEEYLRLIALKKVNIDSLIAGKYPILKAPELFDDLIKYLDDKLLLLLEYDNEEQLTPIDESLSPDIGYSNSNKISLGVIGVGSFAQNFHLPNLRRLDKYFDINMVSSRTPWKTNDIGNRFDADIKAVGEEDIIQNNDIEAVLICTDHSSHAGIALKALKAGKHVFLEKPIAVKKEELEELIKFFNSEGEKPLLFAGFNRRYSKLSKLLKKEIIRRESPVFIRYSVNAGFFDENHKLHQNGGRIVGESCHMIDLCSYLVDSEVQDYNITYLGERGKKRDSANITIQYMDGSVAVIDYFSIGNNELPKEKVEVHIDGKSFVMDDFKCLSFYGMEKDSVRLKRANKGHLKELKVFYDMVKGKRKYTSKYLEDILKTTAISLEL